MPLTPGEDVGTAIKELRTGKTYRRTKRKYGKSRAKKQALAIALHNRDRKKSKRLRRSRRSAKR